MNALNEALYDLIKEVSQISPVHKDRLSQAILQWSNDNFEEFGLTHTMSLEIENGTRGSADYKAHQIVSLACESAVNILHKYGHGETVIKHPWSNFGNKITHRKDYAPSYMLDPNIPQKKLSVKFWALKRKPTSWYDREETKQFLDRLVRS